MKRLLVITALIVSGLAGGGVTEPDGAAASPAAAAPPAASAAGTEFRGVQLHSLWDSSDADMDRELDMALDLGANVVRTGVGWGSLETGGKGQYSQWYLDKLDRFVNGASARGMQVIATLFDTPCWASSAPESLKQGCAGEWWNRNVQMYPPTHAGDYGDIARFVTSRYGTALAALEVWNEPNLDVDRFFIAPDEPAAYAAILKAAYPAAKEGNPDVEVLAGALAYMNGEFLERLYELGIQGYYDGLAVHPYNEGAPTAGNWSGVEWARELQRAAGDTTPLWLTEFGWSTCVVGSGWCTSEQEQASNTVASFAAVAGDSSVKAAIVYNLRDTGTQADDFESNFGLVRRDFSLKPAYTALRDTLAPDAPDAPGGPGDPLIADLGVLGVSDPPPNAARGGWFSVTDTTANGGGAPAGTSRTRYYLSADQVRNSGDRLLIGGRGVPGLAAGADNEGSRSLRVPRNAAPGTYYLLACADDLLRVNESVETNNCRSSASPVSITRQAPNAN